MSVSVAAKKAIRQSIRWPLLLSAQHMAVLMIMTLVLAFVWPGTLLVAGSLCAFALLALWRPDLGLLFALPSTSLFILPFEVWLPGGNSFFIPFNEIVLLLVLASTLLHGLARGLALPLLRQVPTRVIATGGWAWVQRRWANWRAVLPEAMFVLAGIVGVLISLPDEQARRAAWLAFGRFVAEPLTFYVLVRWWLRRDARYGWRVTALAVVGGAAVALLAVLQYTGFEQAAQMLFGTVAQPPFDHGVMVAGNVRRATSVYGNPNIMALYLGRVWPLAAVLAVDAFRAGQRRYGGWWSLCTALCLAGIGVSVSRGAWLGAAGALPVLALAVWHGGTQHRIRRLLPLLMVALVVLCAAGLALSLRGVLIGSDQVRLLLWRESLQLIQRHPFGLGIDQFYFYHNPAFGRSLIDPALAVGNDRLANHPHNVLLEWWLQAGPVCVAAYGWLIIRFFRQARARWRGPDRQHAMLALGAAAAMTAALVHGLVDSFGAWPDIMWMFWLLLALVQPRPAQVQKDRHA